MACRHSSFGCCRLMGPITNATLIVRTRSKSSYYVASTFVTVTIPPFSASFKLIIPTWLLWFRSLIPSGPPSLLAKNTSFVAGTQIGASCANAKVSFSAITRIDGFVPRIERKSSLKIWKNGGVVPVGLKSVEVLRNGPDDPRTANVRGSTSWNDQFNNQFGNRLKKFGN